ncbi:MAG: protein-L-isoaspartate O-methyltransferase [Hyphomicrobiaceae bacterium]
MVDFATLRQNMVESQVRTSNVTDRRVLRAMLDVPRELFVPASLRSLSYMDESIPYDGRDRRAGRGMMPAMAFARLLQLADVGARDLVLVVGAGTGYGTALVARLAMSVVALECDQALADKATATLAESGVDNAAVVVGPLELGCPDEGPFDVIVFEGQVPEVPAAYLSQLREGGRLVAMVGSPTLARAQVMESRSGQWISRADFAAPAPVLPGFATDPGFTL